MLSRNSLGLVGHFLEGQDIFAAGLLAAFGKEHVAPTIEGLDTTLGVVGGVIEALQQGAVAVKDIDNGANPEQAISGAVIHTGAVIGTGALTGAAIGAAATGPFGEVGGAIGAVVGGIAAANGVELVMPSNVSMGQTFQAVSQAYANAGQPGM